MEKGKILVNYLDIFTCKTCLLLKFVDLKFVFPQENGGLRFDLKKKPHFQTFLSLPLKGSPLRMYELAECKCSEGNAEVGVII